MTRGAFKGPGERGERCNDFAHNSAGASICAGGYYAQGVGYLWDAQRLSIVFGGDTRGDGAGGALLETKETCRVSG